MITTEQLASDLQVSISTLAAWRVNGKGPTFVKLGRRVVYDPKAIFAWVSKNTRQSTSEKMEVRNV